jgi:hypothetical protein
VPGKSTPAGSHTRRRGLPLQVYAFGREMGLLGWLRQGKQAKSQPPAPAAPTAPVPSYTARDLPLLNACLCAQSIPELERNPGWPERLGEPLSSAVPRLLAAGILRPATTAERVSVAGGGTQELRELCRRNGLKISGTNEERRRRLYEKNPEIFSSVLNGPEMFICTDEGAKKAWGYRDARDKRAAALREQGPMATFREQISTYLNLGFTSLEVVGGPDCCAACGTPPQTMRMESAEKKLEKMLADCTAPNGCTCAISPAEGSLRS